MQGLLIAARPLFLPGALALYGAGLGLAGWRAPGWLIVLGGAVVTLVLLLTHFVNDAADVDVDERVVAATAFSGGSRAIQRGLITARQLLRAAMVLAGCVLGIIAVEAAAGRWALALIHLATLALGYAYSGWPFALGRRGLGEVTTAFVMAVLVPLAGAQAAAGPAPGLCPLLARLFCETFFARLCTSLPDLEVDRAAGKHTLLALVGPRRAALAFLAAAVAIAGVGLWAAPQLPRPALQRAGALLVAGAALIAAWLAQRDGARRRPALVPQLGLAAYALSLVGLLFALWRPRR